MVSVVWQHSAFAIKLAVCLGSILSVVGDAAAQQKIPDGPRAPVTDRVPTDQWLTFRGSASRNAQASGSAPLPAVSWRVPVTSGLRQERLISQAREQFTSQGLPVIPAASPLAITGAKRKWTLVCGVDRWFCVDFETGKRIWAWPWYSPVFDDDDLEEEESRILENTWRQTAVGNASSDGNSVFLLDRHRGKRRPFRVRRVRLDDGPSKGSSGITAVDLASEGKLHWRTHSDTHPQLQETFFLGAPLPQGDRLYAIAEANSEIRLVVLDVTSGQQEWSQPLQSRADLIERSLHERRLSCVAPSLSDGVLVCPTSSGVIAALDIETQALLWSHAYDQALTPTLGKQLTVAGDRRGGFAESWIDATVAIADKSVVATPVDSKQLLCLDLITGNPKWMIQREGEFSDLLYVACIDRGNVIVVAKNRVVALRLEDGTKSWDAPVTLGRDSEMPSGRGVYGAGVYYLPTTAQDVLAIDLAKGKIVKRTAMPMMLGNLISFRDHVISHGVDGVATFPTSEALEGKTPVDSPSR